MLSSMVWTVVCLTTLLLVGFANSQEAERLCRNVQCPLQQCPFGRRSYTPPGRCCPLCVESGSRPWFCSFRSCSRSQCRPDQIQFTPPASCCPTCASRGPVGGLPPPPAPGTNCAAVSCAFPSNCPNNDVVTPPGQCCPICRRPSGPTFGPDVPAPTLRPPPLPSPPGLLPVPAPGTTNCATVLCAFPSNFPNNDVFTPPGQCCPICRRPSGPTFRPNCAAVACLAVTCPGSFTPPDECCPVCPQQSPPQPTINCALALCARPDCPRNLWYQPRGNCCSFCRDPFPTRPLRFNGDPFRPGT